MENMIFFTFNSLPIFKFYKVNKFPMKNILILFAKYNSVKI